MPKQERGCAGFSEREDEDIYFLHKINSGDPRAKDLIVDSFMIMIHWVYSCIRQQSTATCADSTAAHVFYIL